MSFPNSGWPGETVWTVALCLYSLAGLTSYVTLFAGSAVAVVPVPGMTHYLGCDVYTPDKFGSKCQIMYLVWAALFGITMFGVLRFGVSKLHSLQLSMMVLSVLTVLLASTTIVVALWEHPYSPSVTHRTHPPFITDSLQLANLSGFSLLFSEVIFSQIGHQGIPKLARIARNKSKIRATFTLGICTTVVLYTLFASLSALYFGPATKPESTLNWLSYSSALSALTRDLKFGTQIIITAYPMVVISAAYPLFSLVLADTLSFTLIRLLSGQPPTETTGGEAMTPAQSSEADTSSTNLDSVPPSPISAGNIVDDPGDLEEEPPEGDIATPIVSPATGQLTVGQRMLRGLLQLVVVLISTVAGALIRDISKIVAVTGLFGFFLIFLLPSLLEYFSIRWTRKHAKTAIALAARLRPGDPESATSTAEFCSPFDTVFSTLTLAVCMTVVSLGLFSLAIYFKVAVWF